MNNLQIKKATANATTQVSSLSSVFRAKNDENPYIDSLAFYYNNMICLQLQYRMTIMLFFSDGVMKSCHQTDIIEPKMVSGMRRVIRIVDMVGCAMLSVLYSLD